VIEFIIDATVIFIAFMLGTFVGASMVADEVNRVRRQRDELAKYAGDVLDKIERVVGP